MTHSLRAQQATANDIEIAALNTDETPILLLTGYKTETGDERLTIHINNFDVTTEEELEDSIVLFLGTLCDTLQTPTS